MSAKRFGSHFEALDPVQAKSTLFVTVRAKYGQVPRAVGVPEPARLNLAHGLLDMVPPNIAKRGNPVVQNHLPEGSHSLVTAINW